MSPQPWSHPPAPPVPDPVGPRRRRRWLWLVGIVVTGLLIVVGVAPLVVFFHAYGGHDRLELLDRADVSEAAEVACRTAGERLAAPAGDRVTGVLAGNAAIEQLIADVSAVGDEALDDDLPTRDWLADWSTMAVARARFAERLTADPAATFTAPRTEDGLPIAERMVRAAPDACSSAIRRAAHP